MDTKNRKIILVDDNKISLHQGKAILKPFYEVYPASSAKKLFEILEIILPDLILLDIIMPEVDGFETIKMLKSDKRYAHIPVIFLTAKTDEASELQGFDLGAVDYVTKPFSAPRLLKRIELHEKLEAAIHEANEASRAKSNFLASMSHEIRTPLNVIIGLTDLMIEEDALPDPVRENLTTVSNAGNTLLSIVNDILDLSKIELGKIVLVPVEYLMSDLLNDVSLLLNTYIGEKPVEFKLNINENLPSKLYGDELRVKQILTNLLSNAVKYTHEGMVELSIECEQDGNDVWLDIYVKDTGIGIKEKDIPSLFNEYYQADARTNRKTEGTGLGLSITLHMAELMGGSISVESEYGKGSSFHVRLQQGFVDNTVLGADVSEKLKSFQFSDAKRKTSNKLVRADLRGASVLVVDDMPGNLVVADGFMRKYKMKVDCAACGQEAIDRIQSMQPLYNAVFMDHMMPEMDGIEAVSAIRALGTEYAENIPIIALTANAISGTEKLFLENGFQDFLTKPIDIMLLDHVLKKWVSCRMPEQPADISEPLAEQGDDNTEALHSKDLDIPGLNVQKALSLFGGDMDIYIAALRSFVESTPISLDMLRSVSAETLPDCVITAHGIKGISANICTEQMQMAAAELEATGRNGDLAKFLTLKEPFIIDVERLLSNVKTWLEVYDNDHKSTSDDILSNLDNRHILESALPKVCIFYIYDDKMLIDWSTVEYVVVDNENCEIFDDPKNNKLHLKLKNDRHHTKFWVRYMIEQYPELSGKSYMSVPRGRVVYEEQTFKIFLDMEYFDNADIRKFIEKECKLSRDKNCVYQIEYIQSSHYDYTRYND